MTGKSLKDHLLEAPCPFCGYDGPEYWQKRSHASACPYYVVGGYDERVELLKTFLVDIVKQYIKAVAEQERKEDEGN